jgi:hypothetical protein
MKAHETNQPPSKTLTVMIEATKAMLTTNKYPIFFYNSCFPLKYTDAANKHISGIIMANQLGLYLTLTVQAVLFLPVACF